MKKSDVIKHYGSVAAVAKKLGTSEVAIYKWSEIIPKVRAYEFERLTKGKLKFDPALYQKSQNAA